MHPVMYKSRNPKGGKCRVAGNTTIKCVFKSDRMKLLCIMYVQAYGIFYPPGSVH